MNNDNRTWGNPAPDFSEILGEEMRREEELTKLISDFSGLLRVQGLFTKVQDKHQATVDKLAIHVRWGLYAGLVFLVLNVLALFAVAALLAWAL